MSRAAPGASLPPSSNPGLQKPGSYMGHRLALPCHRSLVCASADPFVDYVCLDQSAAARGWRLAPAFHHHRPIYRWRPPHAVVARPAPLHPKVQSCDRVASEAPGLVAPTARRLVISGSRAAPAAVGLNGLKTQATTSPARRHLLLVQTKSKRRLQCTAARARGRSSTGPR